MSTTQHTPELIFDGCGINGPDEYRTRLATFTRGMDSAQCTKYGALFAAAPELLAALEECAKQINAARLSGFITSETFDGSLQHTFNLARSAIAKATA